MKVTGLPPMTASGSISRRAMKTKRKKPIKLKTREEKQAAYRRKILSRLDPEARKYAIAEFAKLGLFQ